MEFDAEEKMNGFVVFLSANNLKMRRRFVGRTRRPLKKPNNERYR